MTEADIARDVTAGDERLAKVSSLIPNAISILPILLLGPDGSGSTHRVVKRVRYN
jgi:hypothetical protein